MNVREKRRRKKEEFDIVSLMNRIRIGDIR